jgi:hypothetical protein
MEHLRLLGTREQRCLFTWPPFHRLTRARREVTAGQIRAWHRQIPGEISVYSANKALKILKSAFSLASEDHEFRAPAIPTGLGVDETLQALSYRCRDVLKRLGGFGASQRQPSRCAFHWEATPSLRRLDRPPSPEPRPRGLALGPVIWAARASPL